MLLAIICLAGRGDARGLGGVTALQSCQAGWQIVPSADAPSRYGELYGVSALAANDIWAVGRSFPGGEGADQPLAEHWDGNAWTIIASPTPGGDSQLYAVEAVAANDVWAVGRATGGTDYQPLLEHWDGGSWRIVAGGNVPQGGLLGLTATAPNDVWAVGYSGETDTPLSLAEHWDGSTWSVVPTPNVGGASEAFLIAVSGLSSKEVWAVGGYGTEDTFQPLAMRWDGGQWNLVPVSINGMGELTGVKVLAPNDVWVAGGGGVDFSFQPLMMHWNGSVFNNVQVPNTSDSFASLSGLVAYSTNDVWAVGTVDSFPDRDPLVLHWNGSSVEKASAPVPDGGGGLNGATLLPNGDVVVVGGAGSSEGGRTLVEYGTACSSPKSTPTSVPGTPGPQPTLPPATLPGVGSRTFPETGKTVSGLFLGYWDNNGGLAQQGYPISEVFGEVSDLNGQPYTVQYFERAVFEYHPEQKAPYDVQLTALGNLALAAHYPSGTVLAARNPVPSP
ncbi:MAG: hypothetical protein ACJ78Q_13645, partial [Chloroflexia bacterium]